MVVRLTTAGVNAAPVYSYDRCTSATSAPVISAATILNVRDLVPVYAPIPCIVMVAVEPTVLLLVTVIV